MLWTRSFVMSHPRDRDGQRLNLPEAIACANMPTGSKERGVLMRSLISLLFVLNITPVSYTHLDVYKRQAQEFPGLQEPARCQDV